VNDFDISKFPFTQYSYEQLVQFLDTTGEASLTLITERLLDASVTENLKNTFTFSIYQPFTLSPAALTVFYHPDNLFNVTISSGSGHVDTSVESSLITSLISRPDSGMLIFCT
jgi:hypothetical protein